MEIYVIYGNSKERNKNLLFELVLENSKGTIKDLLLCHNSRVEWINYVDQKVSPSARTERLTWWRIQEMTGYTANEYKRIYLRDDKTLLKTLRGLLKGRVTKYVSQQHLLE